MQSMLLSDGSEVSKIKRCNIPTVKCEAVTSLSMLIPLRRVLQESHEKNGMKRNLSQKKKNPEVYA